MAEDLSEIFSAANMVEPTNMLLQKPATGDDAAAKAVAELAAKTAAEEATKAAAASASATTEIPEPVKAWVKEKFNTENPEEVVTGYQSLAQLREQAKDADALRQRTQELETQNKQLSEKPTYKSDFAKKADEIYELTKGKVSAETIARFYDLDPAKLTAEQRLDLLEQIENPESTADDRVLIRNEKYSTAEELGLTDGQKAIRRNDLQKDSAKASERLLQLKSEAFKPVGTDQPDPKAIQAETDRVGFWQQNSKQIDTKPFTVEMPGKLKVPNGKGGVDEVEDNFSFVVPSETQTQVLQLVAKELANPANAKFFTPDADGIKRANDYVKSTVRNAVYDEALKAQAKHFQASVDKVHEYYAKLLNNTDFLHPKAADKGGQAGVVDYNANTEAYLAKHA